jgi:ribA/ribD-fused uncharacterized protein
MAFLTSPFVEEHYDQKYTMEDLIKTYNSKKRLHYIFFWQTDKGALSPGCFSQWQRSYFVADNNRYNCAEQYMMGRKALIFNDLETFDKIVSANHPKQIKSLGREVRNFNATLWDNVKYSVVLNGNFYKFTQNDEMLKILISTGDKIIVEASPLDKIWGVGLSEENSIIENPNDWKGKNLLGFALMEVRDELKKYTNSAEAPGERKQGEQHP